MMTMMMTKASSESLLAGTDANVFVQLYGDRGDSGPLALEHSQTNVNKFERNQKDVFDFQIGDIGELKHIKCARVASSRTLCYYSGN